MENNLFIVIKGIATSNVLDYQGEKITITPKALDSAFPEFLKSGARIKVEHGFSDKYQDRVVGRVIKMEYTPKDFDLDNPQIPKMQILTTAIIEDEEAIRDVLVGNLDAFSIGGGSETEPLRDSTGNIVFTTFKFNELTLTKNPANPEATFEIVDDEQETEETKSCFEELKQSGVLVAKSLFSMKKGFSQVFVSEAVKSMIMKNDDKKDDEKKEEKKTDETEEKKEDKKTEEKKEDEKQDEQKESSQNEEESKDSKEDEKAKDEDENSSNQSSNSNSDDEKMPTFDFSLDDDEDDDEKIFIN